jgi:hypothetical protein
MWPERETIFVLVRIVFNLGAAGQRVVNLVLVSPRANCHPGRAACCDVSMVKW